MRRIRLRARMTIAFATLLAAMASAMVVAVTLYLLYVPNYAPGAPASRSATAPPVTGVAVPGVLAVRSADDVVRVYLIGAACALLVFVAIGAAIAWFMAGRLLRPLREINRAAEQASAGALDHRINLDGPDDEAKDTADTFDRMLDRLQGVFDAQRRFTANAAHELRTPLAANKTLLQVAAAHPSRVTLADLVGRLGEVNEGSIATVEALLTLATAESGFTNAETTELGSAVRAVVAARRPEIEASGLQLRVEAEEILATVDASLWRVLIDNLLVNASRYNCAQGWIEVRLQKVGDRALLTVENTGPPVGAEVSRLTEPFYRSRGRVSSGPQSHGLGLAIVRSIVHAHHGDLEILARPAGGLNVLVRLAAQD